MRPLHVSVRYRYRYPGSDSWTITQWAGHVREPLEGLVLQALRRVKTGCEIELISLAWR